MTASILKRIEAGRRFLVASHEGPDGDAIASTLALTCALREMGKEVVAFNPDPVPDTLVFLPGADSMVCSLDDAEPFDIGFVLDAGELRRAGGEQVRSACACLANIDHHPHSEKFGEFHLVDDKASATGALVYRLLTACGHPISLDVATCIYAAILADTGSFRYANADKEAFSVAGKMIDLGVNPWDVSCALYENQSEARLRLLGEVLPTLEISSCGRLASVCVTLEMMNRSSAGPEHTDGFINFPRSVAGVEVALFFRELEEDRFKVGFRSKGKVDVGGLSRALGGGGHYNAAGAVVDGDIDQVKSSVLGLLDNLMESPCR